MIYFLFGKPGAGKSTVGRTVSQQLGIIYFDCDDLYTPADRIKIQANTFTNEESDDFLKRAIGVLQKYHEQNPHIIASQSLFRQSQRNILRQTFPDSLKLIYLEVDDRICLQRLSEGYRVSAGPEQEPHFYGQEQFSAEIHEFEQPDTVDLRIENNGYLENAVQTLIQNTNNI